MQKDELIDMHHQVTNQFQQKTTEKKYGGNYLDKKVWISYNAEDWLHKCSTLRVGDIHCKKFLLQQQISSWVTADTATVVAKWEWWVPHKRCFCENSIKKELYQQAYNRVRQRKKRRNTHVNWCIREVKKDV